jgi:hypothetical protein
MAEDEAAPTGGLGDLFSQLQEVKADIEAQVEAMEASVVEGTAAGGAVVVRLTGSLEAESVHVDPAVIDPADPALLEDALLAALRDALVKVVQMRSAAQVQVESPFGRQMDLSGLVGSLDLGGLLGGVDVNALMGSLGMGMDLGSFGGQGALATYYEDEDEDDDDESSGDGNTAGDAPGA